MPRFYPAFYTPKFSQHLYSLAINGFYARELDADDHEFLERVKVRGIANGDLPNASAVLIDELEFWHLPYAIDASVSRRAGPLPRRPAETEQERAWRLLRTSAWHARRAIREHDKAIAAAELERERREWEAAAEQRRLRDALSDAEWEAAAPTPRRRKRKFGMVVNRHYVPQWKIDDEWEEKEAARLAAKAARLAAVERRRKQAIELIERANAKWAAAEADQKQNGWIYAIKKRRAAKAEREAARQATIAEREEAMRAALRKHQQWREEAERTLAQVEMERRRRLEQERAAAPSGSWVQQKPDIDEMIVTLIRSNPFYEWTIESLERATGIERDTVREHVRQLLSDGRLRPRDNSPP